MNMHSMSEPSYRNLNHELHVAYFDAACISVVGEDKSIGLSRVSVDDSCD